jgi:hypothetical protein
VDTYADYGFPNPVAILGALAYDVEPHFAVTTTRRQLHNKEFVTMPTRLVKAALLIFLSIVEAKADELTVPAWIDLYIDLCVGSGSSTSTTVSGSIDTDTGITLEKRTLDGSLKGEVVLSRQQFRLLSDGINDKMSEIAASEADKVRNCLEPVRRQLLAGTSSDARSLQILSPDEDKIIRALATNTGRFDEVGRAVPTSTIREVTGLGAIRTRSAFRSLQRKLFASVALVPGLSGGMQELASLSDAGEEYALSMNYAN